MERFKISDMQIGDTISLDKINGRLRFDCDVNFNFIKVARGVLIADVIVAVEEQRNYIRKVEDTIREVVNNRPARKKISYR